MSGGYPHYRQLCYALHLLEVLLKRMKVDNRPLSGFKLGRQSQICQKKAYVAIVIFCHVVSCNPSHFTRQKG